MSTLILLVGSNPLPNYLSACTLRPSGIVLVYTTETKDAKDRLKCVLNNTLGNQINLSEEWVEDATCATNIGRTINAILPNKNIGEAWLNYTGGTKVMAVQARMAFKDRGGKPEHASYLDEGGLRQPRLRFDDGTSKSLDECNNVPLTLKTILGLHGFTYKPRSRKSPAPTTDDADAIIRAVLSNVELAQMLYEHSRILKPKNPMQAAREPFKPDKHGLALSVTQLPTGSQMNRDAFETWCSFIGGEWLEEWLGRQIVALELQPPPEIVVGVNAQRGAQNANLEVDIAVVRGHRSYFISCTTDTTKRICKSKLFEIAVRSRQLGGELARAAVVCLADDQTVQALRRDIADVWGAANTTRVFGLSDLKAWSGSEQNETNLTNLKSWLES